MVESLAEMLSRRGSILLFLHNMNRLLNRILSFDKLLGLTAFTIAIVAAFFSVYGIATLFAGAFTLTIIMASALEVGKLVSVTFLYRYWQKTKGFLKTYLCLATFVLMLVTSLGIFGYLSAAYQKSSIEFKAGQEKITLIEGQKVHLHDKISQSRTRIQTLNDLRAIQEDRLSQALTNAFLTRNPLQLKQLQDQTVDMIKSADENIKTEQERIQKTTDEIHRIDQQVNEMRFSSAGKKDIRTFQFVADQFGTTLDGVAKWFILTLIFVFDPLAIALILAYNITIYKEKRDDVTPEIKHEDFPKEPLSTKRQLICDADVELSTAPVEKKDEPSPESSIESEIKRVFKL
jgi:hypothetical protein